MDECWGIWIPTMGPVDRPAGGWLPPLDDVGVPCAMVFRSRDDAEAALQIQSGLYELPWDAEPRPFHWSAEEDAAQ